VVSAAVVLQRESPVPSAQDSKLMSPAAREDAYRRIVDASSSFAVGAASAREIDRNNIASATIRAMRRTLARLPWTPGVHIVVDGPPVGRLGFRHDAIVGGDGLIHSISCASIVAKVTRDRLMKRLAKQYPGYGWSRNAGYGTREHLDAIGRLGTTPHHRISFRGAQGRLALEEPVDDGG